jgi:hypothetical protein
MEDTMCKTAGAKHSQGTTHDSSSLQRALVSTMIAAGEINNEVNLKPGRDEDEGIKFLGNEGRSLPTEGTGSLSPKD